MVQQLVANTASVAANSLSWASSSTSLRFHQGLLHLIPGDANDIGKPAY